MTRSRDNYLENRRQRQDILQRMIRIESFFAPDDSSVAFYLDPPQDQWLAYMSYLNIRLILEGRGEIVKVIGWAGCGLGVAAHHGCHAEENCRERRGSEIAGDHR